MNKRIKPVVIGIVAVGLISVGGLLPHLSASADSGSFSCPEGQIMHIDVSVGITCLEAPVVAPAAVVEPVVVPDPTLPNPDCQP